jgi:FkbM family methyltransferase
MKDVVLRLDNGWAVMPASLRSANGTPRFLLQFPANLVNDQGARHLVLSDANTGYELATRNLIERTLRTGDLFIDVGAHWGYFTLQAATHPAGSVRTLAFEADPLNASVLHHNLVKNNLTAVSQLVCAACGDHFDLAALVANTSMGHSIRGVGLKYPFGQGPPKWVPVLALDDALTYFPDVVQRRIILKIDVEGFEPQVIAGARGLIASGRVALIIWEMGHAFADGPERRALLEMLETLDRFGYGHVRPRNAGDSDACCPLDIIEPYVGNVFSQKRTQPSKR